MSEGGDPATADWSRHLIWWQVYPLGFLGAPPTSASGPPRRRLRDLTAWLDHLVGLGANGLALGPVFASETHGYDTVDYYRIDPRLGTADDFDALVAACHARGVRVLLDGVFHHVGRGFAAFRDVLDHGRSSAYTSWFHLEFDDDADDNGAPVGSPTHPDGFDYADFEGHRQLVRLNHEEPAVAAYVADVMAYWCARGVDAWRLDAAYAVPPAFWRKVTERMRTDHPDTWIVGEVIHGDYAGFVRESGIDSVTQYELWKAIWSSLNDRNFFELAWSLDRHRQLLESFWPQTFVGNHDVTRILSTLTDARHLGHALAVLFATPGVPTVYYGDELGLRGIKEERFGGDDAIRPVFPSVPAALTPEQRGLVDLHRELIACRRRHGWLVHALPQKPDTLTNEHLLYRVGDPAGNALAVALNVGDTRARIPLPTRAAWTLEAGTADVEPAGGEPGVLRVPAHSWAVLASPAGGGR